MQGLEVELVLRLLTNNAQIRPQGGLCNWLGVVVVVLLSLYERLDIDRGMIRGWWPRWRSARLTKCALRHASMPTTQGGAS